MTTLNTPEAWDTERHKCAKDALEMMKDMEAKTRMPYTATLSNSTKVRCNSESMTHHIQ